MLIKITRKGVSRYIDEKDARIGDFFASQGYELVVDEKGEAKKFPLSVLSNKSKNGNTNAIASFKKA
jgi:hypothetical protein